LQDSTCNAPYSHLSSGRVKANVQGHMDAYLADGLPAGK
jgi:hypothetical protein